MSDENKQYNPIPDKQDLACEVPTPAEISGEPSQAGSEPSSKSK